ncbi:hypothetical protein IAQ61_003882 [Plenodomus lingam]|uniref:uncharacterized protein n=1 Tax=Leptosphaeria maculans TaxID=5022 RepID=UPI0033240A3E|nr:hypothetical protein IAQ61_003882 [Plenodomus lingam]
MLNLCTHLQQTEKGQFPETSPAPAAREFLGRIQYKPFMILPFLHKPPKRKPRLLSVASWGLEAKSKRSMPGYYSTLLYYTWPTIHPSSVSSHGDKTWPASCKTLRVLPQPRGEGSGFIVGTVLALPRALTAMLSIANNPLTNTQPTHMKIVPMMPPKRPTLASNAVTMQSNKRETIHLIPLLTLAGTATTPSILLDWSTNHHDTTQTCVQI